MNQILSPTSLLIFLIALVGWLEASLGESDRV